MCKYFILTGGSCLRKWKADQLCNGNKAVIEYTSVPWQEEEQSKSIWVQGASSGPCRKCAVNQAIWNGELFTPLITARVKWTISVFMFTELYLSPPAEMIVWGPRWAALHLVAVFFIRTLTCCFYSTRAWLASGVMKDLVWANPGSPLLHTKRERLKGTTQPSFFSFLWHQNKVSRPPD